jgi:hypothetical protein
MRVIVAGAVAWADAGAIRRELESLPPGTVVVHGDCLGADAIAGEVGRELGFAVERWVKSNEDAKKHGRPRAWMGLNERMLASGTELVLVFHTELYSPDAAHGSKHLMALANAEGVEVRAFTS